MTTRHAPAPDITGQYALACILEEAGEAIQIGGKILRHGWSSYSPYDPDGTMNRTLLAQELGDLFGAVDFAISQGLLDQEVIGRYQVARLMKLTEVAPLEQ